MLSVMKVDHMFHQSLEDCCSSHRTTAKGRAWTSGQGTESWEIRGVSCLLFLRVHWGWGFEVREDELVLKWEPYNEGDFLVHEHQRAGKGSVQTVCLYGS